MLLIDTRYWGACHCCSWQNPGLYMQEPPTRKQRLGPTTEQARFQEPNIFSRFLPETWVTADLPIEEVCMSAGGSLILLFTVSG